MVKRILSLGAGVQSSTLLLMACQGAERIDAAVFADTGFEPAAVYKHLGWLKAQAELAGIPLDVVSAGNIRDNELDPTRQVGRGKYTLVPYHAIGTDGHDFLYRRQCTSRYKIEPIQKWLRAQGASAELPVDLLLGISWDEMQRIRDSRVPIARNVYPLVERRMTRNDCLRWLAERGYPEPPKSACIHCPYRRTAGWRRMQEEAPKDFAQAVAFDAQIRHLFTAIGPDTEAYLHESRVPLGEVDLRSEQQKGQLEMFEFGADGCGVLCPSDTTA